MRDRKFSKPKFLVVRHGQWLDAWVYGRMDAWVYGLLETRSIIFIIFMNSDKDLKLKAFAVFVQFRKDQQSDRGRFLKYVWPFFNIIHERVKECRV